MRAEFARYSEVSGQRASTTRRPYFTSPASRCLRCLRPAFSCNQACVRAHTRARRRWQQATACQERANTESIPSAQVHGTNHPHKRTSGNAFSHPENFRQEHLYATPTRLNARAPGALLTPGGASPVDGSAFLTPSSAASSTLGPLSPHSQPTYARRPQTQIV